MGKKIVVKPQLFTMEQTILLFDMNDGTTLAARTIQSLEEELIPQLISLTKEYEDVKQIVFVGPKHYNRIYGKKFQEYELSQYGENHIEIKYI